VIKLEKMTRSISVALVPLSDLIERMRLLKTEQEISLLKKSVLLNERVFQLVYNTIEPGMTEIEIALALELTMRELGAEGPSFDTIVAFGTNTAEPHAVPTERILQSGDLVLIDMGLVLQGYSSDMTRTIVLGRPDKKTVELFRLVRKAQTAGMAAIKAGVIANFLQI
jgi:Xaa-Pro aminopeptidase